MRYATLKIIAGVLVIQALAVLTISMGDFSSASPNEESVPTVRVLKRTYPIDVRTIGELEAAQSIIVASSIRSDQPKVIELIADGASVEAGELLVKIDATPIERRIEELGAKAREAESKLKTNQQSLQWEIEQAEHEMKTLILEMEATDLELKKIIYGDGPLEEARLKGAMQKAKVKFDELSLYSEDLIELETQGFLSQTEVRQTQKKLLEEQENYENARMQYESFRSHVQPMQIKKAETALKRLVSKQEEAERSGKFNIEKARISVTQIQQEHAELLRQIRECQHELNQTEIRAPAAGMVVLREEYRSNQRRKPRVGDTLVRNQAILDLPDLASMVIKSKVREIDLYKIAIGKPVDIEVDAFPNMLLQGKVSFIGILALTDVLRVGDEKHFEVKINIDNIAACLRPGMTARVTIHADRVQEQLSVPIHAVFEVEKQHYCYVARKNAYFMTPVKIGMNNEEWVHVISGLQEGDEVCLSLPPDHSIAKVSPASNETAAQTNHYVHASEHLKIVPPKSHFNEPGILIY